jgi:hypothetical protein
VVWKVVVYIGLVMLIGYSPLFGGIRQLKWIITIIWCGTTIDMIGKGGGDGFWTGNEKRFRHRTQDISGIYVLSAKSDLLSAEFHIYQRSADSSY